MTHMPFHTPPASGTQSARGLDKHSETVELSIVLQHLARTAPTKLQRRSSGERIADFINRLQRLAEGARSRQYRTAP